MAEGDKITDVGTPQVAEPAAPPVAEPAQSASTEVQPAEPAAPAQPTANAQTASTESSTGSEDNPSGATPGKGISTAELAAAQAAMLGTAGVEFGAGLGGAALEAGLAAEATSGTITSSSHDDNNKQPGTPDEEGNDKPVAPAKGGPGKSEERGEGEEKQHDTPPMDEKAAAPAEPDKDKSLKDMLQDDLTTPQQLQDKMSYLAASGASTHELEEVKSVGLSDNLKGRVAGDELSKNLVKANEKPDLDNSVTTTSTIAQGGTDDPHAREGAASTDRKIADDSEKNPANENTLVASNITGAQHADTVQPQAAVAPLPDKQAAIMV